MIGHEGHRNRIIQKLDSGVLLEHELLEILLFNAVPRKNTNDLAHRLLAQFHTIKGIFTASEQELESVRGVGKNVAAYLVCVGEFYKRYFESSKSIFDEPFNPRAFLSYIKIVYEDEKVEVLDAYLLDKENKIFKRKRFSGGTSSNIVFAVEDFTQALLTYKPCGIVLVHNHPNGLAKPSIKDETTTEKCQMLCALHNVLFCDHFIYAPDGVYSYYLSGKMQKISKDFSVKNLLSKNGGNS